MLAARWSVAFPFLFSSPASVVAAFRPCGPALSPELWRHPGYFSSCFQPCLCDVWYVQDLEGLVDALLGTSAAATVYMTGELSKHAAAACAAAFDLLDFCDGGFVDLVGDLAFSSSVDCSAAAFVYEYCECGKLAEAAAAAMIWLLELFEGYFSFLVGGSVLTSLLVLSVAGKFSKLAAAAFAAAHDVDGCHDFIYSDLMGVFLLGLLVLLVGVSTVLDGDSAVLVGALFLFNFYLCLPGGRSPKEENVFYGPIFCTSQKQSCQVDSSPDYDQGSGKHGIVRSLPVGWAQASGRVDVPDDAKIEAAAAFGGALRSGPGSLDALGLARSREGKIQFFLKGHDGCTRVINCYDGDLIHDVVGIVGWDIYATLHGHILDLSGTLQSQGVSDNDTIRIFCRLRGGSNNADIPGQWQCANCDATRCWPVRRNCSRCGAPRPDSPPAPAPWNAGRNRGRSKGPLGRDPPPGPSNVPPTTREPRVVPPRGPPGAGVGTPPRDTDSAVLLGELLGALKLLQTVMSAEDFSKYEKLVAPPSKEERTKEREQLLWEKVQSQNRGWSR